MKKVVRLAVVNCVLASTAFAGPLVIYGEDNRQEVFEASAAHQALAKSTASMVSKNEITPDIMSIGVVKLTQKTLSDWLKGPAEEETKSAALAEASAAGISFCPGTRFVEQPNPAMCSGFLIAPDLIVTAGHCAELENMCDEYRWVFDFHVNKETNQAGLDIKEENVFKCKKVVSNLLNNKYGYDYAVIQLDRQVPGRTPLEINDGKSIGEQQSLLVIGNPSGLPTKVAPGAKVRNNFHPNYFSANLDTFQGNSGSAVFNADTGVVEGILVRGEEDYVPNYQLMCIEANVCETDACRGEDVSRMTSIPEVAVNKYLMMASTTGDMEILNKVLELNTWVDFNTRDGQSALIKASAAAQNEAMKALLAKGADVNKQDALGNTSLHALAQVLTQTNADALATLVQAGANLEARNGLGETALLAAGKSLNLEAVKLIIAAGADKNAVNANGENVLLSFAGKGDEKAVLELMSMGVENKSVMTKIVSK